ncbi:MAG: hypothetical protein ACFFDT_25170, partial [Candidatus Hodarchaeota archaeon]
QRIIDFGNGTLGFLVIVTDDQPEEYYGTGIENVSVVFKVQNSPFGRWSRTFNLTYIEYIGSAMKYFGIITTSAPDNPREFFGYGEIIQYNISMIDYAENVGMNSFSKYLDFDGETPKINSVPIQLDYSQEIDGNLNISFIASDNWSGLWKAFIRIFDENSNIWSEIREMNRINQSSSGNERDRALYWVNYLFVVGFTYKYEITVIDISGKSTVESGNILINDKSAPIFTSLVFNYTSFGEFYIRVTVVDNGSAINTVVLSYIIGKNETLLNLREVEEGGVGSEFHEDYEYSQPFSLKFQITPDLISKKTVQFSLILNDSEGNERIISHSRLSDYLKGSTKNGFDIPSVPTDIIQLDFFVPLVVIFALGLLLLSVRRFRVIGGFDKNKVLADLVRISDDEVWQKNDSISIGVFANFFDQVKGPVPIIWYPDKVGIAEKLRFNLADRSFSTLGFVSKSSEEKDATFRYHFAGENCMVFGYAFAAENPEARGGQENLSICFLIRPPWGNLENLNKFRSELVEHFRKISELIKSNADVKIIQQKMQDTRNFFTRAMLTFRRKFRQEFLE